MKQTTQTTGSKLTMSSSKEEETQEKGGEGTAKAGKDEMTDVAMKLISEPSTAQATATRSERKRNREQKRRNEVNSGLDQLTRLIFIIDPQLKAVAELRASKSHSGGRRPPGVSDTQLLSRVELINSAVATLARVHQENEERKLMIARLTMGAAPGNAGVNPLMGSAAGGMLGAASLMAAGSPLRMQGNPTQLGASGEKVSKAKEKEPVDETKEGGPVTKRMKKRQEK